ncbi:unnamed protein product [Gongylonema pulchrum]|uniref:Nonstructural protein n=1 Tax=Gongylonema pulchrum TaxID=637853 RepID=A0A183EVA4_9BILA|nr:unnamed protein product [Gongylonema pulchrum]
MRTFLELSKVCFEGKQEFCDYVFNYNSIDYCYSIHYVNAGKYPDYEIFKNMETVDQLLCQPDESSARPVFSSVTFRNEAEFHFVTNVYRSMHLVKK